MAKSLHDWSVTDGSNNFAVPDGAPEGWTLPQINDHNRAAMGVIARFDRDNDGSLVTATSTTAYTLALNQVNISAWYNGLKWRTRIHATCGATPTINPTPSGGSALGAKSLYWNDGTQVTTGDLVANGVYDMVYESGTDKVYVLSNSGKPFANPLTTRGDIIIENSTPAPARLAVGAANTFLGSDGTDPAYKTAAQVWTALSGAFQVLPRGHLAGLTLSNNGGAPTNKIDIAAGKARDGGDAIDLVLGSTLTKQLDAAWAVGNAGGLDTGAVGNNTYFVWLIRRSDTGVVDALFSLSATAPTMPTNYDTKRRIGAILREGGAIVSFVQEGDYFRRVTLINSVDATNPGTSAVTRTANVPTLAGIHAILLVTLNNVTSTSLYCLITALDETDSTPSITLHTVGAPTANATFASTEKRCRVDGSAQFRSRFSVSAGSDRLIIATLGWIDTRGRND